MKKCQQCNREYSDDTLSSCPEDGAILSAFYNPPQTYQPTDAFSIPEIPAFKTPNTAGPAYTNGQTEAPRVRWYIYLLGFVTSLLVYEAEIYLIFPLYTRLTKELVLEIGDKFEIFTDAGIMIASALVLMPIYLSTLALLGFIFGYIWSKTEVKWGLILILPYLFYRFYNFVRFLIDDEETALQYFVLSFFVLFIMLVTAGYFSNLGSNMKKRAKTHSF